jgi:hypothetical protein
MQLEGVRAIALCRWFRLTMVLLSTGAHGDYLHAGTEMPGCVTARVVAQRAKDGYASPEFGICLSQPIVWFEMPGVHERRRSLTVASCMRSC